jgi:hypothetical protein
MRLPEIEALAVQYWHEANTIELVELLTKKVRGWGWHTCTRERNTYHEIHVGRYPLKVEDVDSMEFCWYVVVYKLPVVGFTEPYYQMHYRSKGVHHNRYINVVTTVGEIMATLHAGLAFSPSAQ